MKKFLIIAVLFISATTLFAQGRYKPEPVPAPYSYVSNLFRSVDGTYINLEADNGISGANSYFNILDWLQGRVAGLQVYTIRGTRVPFMRNAPATLYVDEIRTDASYLGMLPVADIALIKIMKMPGIISGPGGAIAIYTKRGEAEEEEEVD